MEKKGIDVSHHNGSIDWARVAAQGVDFAIVKIGNGSKKNTPSLDPRFDENARGAAAAGIAVGGYVASYAMEPEHARQEAAFFAGLLGGYKGVFSYPIFYDMEGEGTGGFYDQWPLGKEKISDICQAFVEGLTAAGWLCGIYVNENWRRNRIREELQVNYPLWLAHYNIARPSYEGRIGIWQRSAVGSVAGVRGNVDMNIGYEDYPARIRALGLNGFAADDTPPARTMRMGDAGEDVLRLMLRLAAGGYLKAASFDGITRAALMACQEEAGLPITGEADEQTMRALCAGEG